MKEILLKKIGIGFLMVVIFNLVLFVISLIFASESFETNGPTLIPAVIFAILMGLIVFGVLKWLKPTSQKEAFGYSISWAIIVFAAILFITIPNGTTAKFFGHWFDWLSFGAMAAAPLLMKRSTKKPEEAKE